MRNTLGTLLLGCALITSAYAATPNQTSTKETPTLKHAVLAGGCYWCVEAVFEELQGVKEAVSGFAGSSVPATDAEDAHRKGHAEAVRITYDPAVIDYVGLLEVFFATHDPTTLNRQGPDVGVEYRSAIFYADDAEREAAQGMIAALTESHAFDQKIVTTIEPLKEFHPAPDRHQNYVCNNPGQPYVESVAMEKVKKVRTKFKDRLKAESPLNR